MTDREAAAGLVERLRQITSTRLSAPEFYLTCATINEAATLITTLLSELERVGKERDEAWEIVAACNNSVFGTHSYFADANGKTTAQGIEEIKDFSGAQWLRANAAEARALKAEALVAEAVRVCEPFAKRAGKLDGHWLDHETHWSPAYGSTEITIRDLRAARAFIEKAKS